MAQGEKMALFQMLDFVTAQNENSQSELLESISGSDANPLYFPLRYSFSAQWRIFVQHASFLRDLCMRRNQQGTAAYPSSFGDKKIRQSNDHYRRHQ
jgi:hypothetical protein